MKKLELKSGIKKVFLVITVIILVAIIYYTQQSNDTAYKIKYSYFLDYEATIDNKNTEKFKFYKKEWEEKIIYNEKNEYNSNAGNIWAVSLEANKIMISSIKTQNSEVNPSQQYKVNPLRFDLDDGYFISKSDKDYEDISGMINYIGNDGVSYTVSKYVNPLVIFSINGDVFLLEGRSYRSSDRGSLYKFSNSDGKWEIKKGIDEISLEGYPYQFMIENSDIYIIVYKRIWDNEYYKYYNNYHMAPMISTVIKISTANDALDMQEIVKTVFLPANSIAKKNKTLYIGLKGSVAVVDLNTNEIKFYTKK